MVDQAASSVSDESSTVLSLVKSCAVLAAVVAPASFVVAVICYRELTVSTLLAAAVAGGVCWLAASLALLTTHLGNLLESPVQGVLGGMLFRMGLPLIAVIGLSQLGGDMARMEVSITIVGVYLVALVAETLLSLRLVPGLGAGGESGEAARA